MKALGIEPLTDSAVWLGRRVALAYYRRALAERVGPMHPDRVRIEGRIAQLERLV